MNKYLAPILLVAALLSACGAGPSSEEYVADAKSHLESGSYIKAIIALKNAVQFDKQNAEARWLLGKAYVATHQYKSAVKELELASDAGQPLEDVAVPLARAYLGVGPKVAQEYLVNLVISQNAGKALPDSVREELDLLSGLALLQSGQAAAANTRFRQIEKEHPETLIGRFAAALAAFQERRFVEARKQLDRALEIGPADARVLALYGNVLYSEGNTDGAVEYLDRAIAADHYSILYRLTLVDVLVESNKIDDAENRLDALDKILSNHPRKDYFRSRIEYARGQYDQALASVQKSLSELRNDGPTQFLAGLIAYRLGRFEQAAAYLAPIAGSYATSPEFVKLSSATLIKLGETEKALALSPAVLSNAELEDASYVSAIGAVFAGTGNFEAADEHLVVAAGLNKTDTAALRALGLVRLKQGDTKGSLDAMKEALKRDPNLPDAEAVQLIEQVKNNDWEIALVSARKMLEKDPDSLTARNLLGVIQAGRLQYDEAEIEFRKVLELAPDNPDAANNLSLLLERRGDFLGARDYLALAGRSWGSRWPVLRRLSLLELKLGSVKDAVKWLQVAVKNNSALSPEPVAALAGTYLRVNDPESALRTISTFSSAGGQANDLIVSIRADAELQTGSLEAGKDSLRELVKVRGEDVSAWYKLSRVSERTGDFALALQSAKRAYELEPASTSVKQLYAENLLRAGRAKEATPITTELLRSDEKNVEYLNLNARLQQLQGDLAGSVETLKTALELRRNSTQVRNLATALIRGQRESEAVAVLEDWLSEHPEDEATSFALADFLLVRGKLDGAEKHFRRLIETNPRVGLYQNNLAWVLYLKGKPKEAKTHAELAYRINSEEPHWLDTLGAILLDLGEFERALELLGKAANALPGDKALKTNYAWALLENGRLDHAERLITVLLSDEQPFRNREKAKELLEKIRSQ